MASERTKHKADKLYELVMDGLTGIIEEGAAKTGDYATAIKLLEKMGYEYDYHGPSDVNSGSKVIDDIADEVIDDPMSAYDVFNNTQIN